MELYNILSGIISCRNISPDYHSLRGRAKSFVDVYTSLHFVDVSPMSMQCVYNSTLA